VVLHNIIDNFIIFENQDNIGAFRPGDSSIQANSHSPNYF